MYHLATRGSSVEPDLVKHEDEVNDRHLFETSKERYDVGIEEAWKDRYGSAKPKAVLVLLASKQLDRPSSSRQLFVGPPADAVRFGILSMAGLVIGSPTLHLISASRYEFLAIAQAPKIRRRLPPIHSRASCSWSRPQLSQSPLVPLRPLGRVRCQVQRNRAFSTCLVLRQSDNGEKPKVPDQENRKVGLDFFRSFISQCFSKSLH
jgi:hypothetical protein